MQSFPKPLSAKEESECIKRFREGDRDARNRLIECNLRLVAYLVKKYNVGDRDVDDLISIGTIGLIKAIDTYKEDKGVRLATYASRCIDNELLMMLRSDKKQAKEVYLYEPIGVDDGEGNHISLLDILETTDEDIAERIELEENIGKLYDFVENKLGSREKEIIRLRYGLLGREVTQREIAKKLGISRSYVSRIEKKALKKLRDAYENRKNL
ncbi:MAG: RNA polymerase sporulation sigma factor SigK [Lachnoclostridium sp.]|nr:RNA polymerase sporulation sigma factor SigK [Lachnoclostridium sp.]